MDHACACIRGARNAITTKTLAQVLQNKTPTTLTKRCLHKMLVVRSRLTLESVNDRKKRMPTSSVGIGWPGIRTNHGLSKFGVISERLSKGLVRRRVMYQQCSSISSPPPPRSLGRVEHIKDSRDKVSGGGVRAHARNPWRMPGARSRRASGQKSPPS